MPAAMLPAPHPGRRMFLFQYGLFQAEGLASMSAHAAMPVERSSPKFYGLTLHLLGRLAKTEQGAARAVSTASRWLNRVLEALAARARGFNQSHLQQMLSNADFFVRLRLTF